MIVIYKIWVDVIKNEVAHTFAIISRAYEDGYCMNEDVVIGLRKE